MDVGGTSIKHAVIDGGEILEKGSTRTPSTKEGFTEAVREITETYGEKYAFKDITLSFPGYINPKTGFAETSGALRYFKATNILDQIKEALGPDYDYHIENDANCAAIAEKNSGNAQGDQSFLLVTVGTGFGGAFYVNDALVRGFQFKAGEFGKMRIRIEPEKDARLNWLASVKTLIRNYKALKKMPEDARVSGEDILDRLDDQETAAFVDEWIRHICVGIYNVTTVLNPEKILIGGGISSHPQFLPLVRETMRTFNDWGEFEVPIETCRYHNDAGLMGAYYNSLKN